MSNKKSAASSNGRGYSAEQQKSFTSWKLDVEKALLFDERLNASIFRIAAYILSCVNAKTRTAHVTDETISLLVPKCRSRTTVHKARTALRDTGWIDFTQGRSGKATIYRFNEKNVNPVMDVVTAKRDWRDEERRKRRSK